MKFTHIIVLFVCLMCFCVLTPPVYGRMRIHHINVGQADATLLEFENAAVLVDAGGSNIRGTRERDHLWNYLNAFFISRPALRRTLYSLIVTHPHIDHTRHLMEVLRGFPGHPGFRIRNFVDNGDQRNPDPSRSPGYAPLNSARTFIAQQNGPQRPVYNKIDAQDIGPSGYTTAWLAELANAPSSVDIRFLNASRICSDPNNDSLVILVTHGQSKVLITGDAEVVRGDETVCAPAITRVLTRFGNQLLRNISVYKAGHHGSHNGTSDQLIRLLSPRISVISAGFRTDRDETSQQRTFDAFNYGHPRREAVDRMIQFTRNSRPSRDVYTMSEQRVVVPLNNLTKAVYCTCWDGDIVIEADVNGNVNRVMP